MDRLVPPVAEKIPKDVSVHGEPRVDEYYWLRERDDHKVTAHLHAENDYTSSVLQHTERFQERLYQELVSRIKETDASVPERIDGYYYYSRNEAGKQYAIHCRRRAASGAEEEVILDENELATEHDYFALGVLEISPNHRFLAYSADTDGSESFTLRIKDLESGRDLPESVPGTYYGVEWANDSTHIFYSVLDAAMRPHKLYRHRLNDSPDRDEMVFHEPDDAYFLNLQKTKSRKYILVSLGSNTTTEVHYLDADDPMDAFRLIHPRKHLMEYYVVHRDTDFYILTNDDAKNFKLMRAPVSEPSIESWEEVVPHRKSVKLDDVDAFADFLVLYERENGLKSIRVIDAETGAAHTVPFEEPVYTFWAAENPEFSESRLRFNYTSLTTPRTVIDYDMRDQTREIKKVYEVCGEYDLDAYVSERIFATAPGGTRIPVSLVYRRDTPRDGSARMLLHGYGAYGACIEPFFVANRLSLLDRGFVFAIAHVRGGGEMGRNWYDQGKLLNKRNTFTDYIACAEHLIAKKYTSAGKIVAYGGSAGGMLVGAAVNMRPDLFGAVVAHVPFVDVVTTMLDDSIPLTVIEYEEWGNPRDKKFYEYMRSYSPYDNVKEQNYPHMLVTGGLNDPRVQYWEPAKWVARLRDLKTDGNTLLLRTKMGEGHSGASGRYDYLRDIAFEYAFILDCFGASE